MLVCGRAALVRWPASVVVAASANRPSHRSQDGEREADHKQDRPDDNQKVDAGDEESDDEQNDAERDQRVSPDGLGLRAERASSVLAGRASTQVRERTYPQFP